MRMGLPIDRLVIATNVNDILARTLATGAYEPREVVATTSPSMDIQVASNFERILFEADGRDAESVRAMMASLAQSRRFALPARDAVGAARDVLRQPRRRAGDRGRDPHHAARDRPVHRSAHRGRRRGRREGERATRRCRWWCSAPRMPRNSPMPSRPPAAQRPPLPDWLGDLYERPERVTTLPVDQAAVERHILSSSRAAREGAAA